MLYSRQWRMLINFCKRLNMGREFNSTKSFHPRNFHVSAINSCSQKASDSAPNNQIVVRASFEDVKNKNKESYLDMVKIFIGRDVHRRGHVEFIYAALKNMETFNVHKDIEVYKALIDILPKGKFIPQNIFQAEFMHYPKQQQCIIDLLEQMEDNGVLPDGETETMLLNIFGKRGHPLRKYWRMLYWMPKFKNLSPWPVPNPPPSDGYELAKLAIARISSIDIHSKVTTYQSSDIIDAIDDTWIVSAQSPAQIKLLSEHKQDEPIYVEGSFRLWLRNKSVNYFILRANPKPIVTVVEEDTDDVSQIKVSFFNFFSPPKAEALQVIPSVHEQDDGIILAVCATGTSSKDSLLSWIRHLEKDGNPALANIPVVFTLRSSEKGLTTAENKRDKEELDDH